MSPVQDPLWVQLCEQLSQLPLVWEVHTAGLGVQGQEITMVWPCGSLLGGGGWSQPSCSLAVLLFGSRGSAAGSFWTHRLTDQG